MNIPNMQAFAQFIKSNNLTGICAETNLIVNCLEEYSLICGSCGAQKEAESKKKTCLTFYVNFVSKANNYKAQLFRATGGTVITFNDNQRYLGSITR